MTTRFAPMLLIGLALQPMAAVDRGERTFDSIVEELEGHFGKHRLYIPFLGALSFVSGIARPLGASDFKLAVIEGVHQRAGRRAFDFHPGGNYRPFLRVQQRNGESVAIFGKDEGHRAVRTFMVVVDGDDAVAMQMRLSPTHFLQLIAERAREHHMR